MKRFLLTALVAAAPLPVLAGGITLDLPRLSFPESPPVSSGQTCLNPTNVTMACPGN